MILDPDLNNAFFSRPAAHIVPTDLAGRTTIGASWMVSYCHPVDGMRHCYLWVIFFFEVIQIYYVDSKN